MAKRTLLLAAMFAIADQIVKQLVISFVKPVYTVTVINGLFDLDYVQNRGAAFGILEQHRWIFISGTIIAIILFVIFLFKTNIKSKLFMLSASLIVGGGIGNLIDRIYLGYVVDYLHWSFFPPVCNLADYCITCGAALLFIYLLFFSQTFEKKKVISKDE